MSLPISWIGAGRMAAGIQETPDLYGLPFQIPASPIRYFLRRARPGARRPVQMYKYFSSSGFQHREPMEGKSIGSSIMPGPYSHQAGGRRAPSFSTTVFTHTIQSCRTPHWREPGSFDTVSERAMEMMPGTIGNKSRCPGGPILTGVIAVSGARPTWKQLLDPTWIPEHGFRKHMTTTQMSTGDREKTQQTAAMFGRTTSISVSSPYVWIGQSRTGASVIISSRKCTTQSRRLPEIACSS